MRRLGVAVLADTHIRSGGRRRLPLSAYAVLERADVILHGGDVVDHGLLAELGGLAPTHAVLGNNDSELAGELPCTRVLDLGGVEVAMVHDSGPRRGREARLRRRFPTADIVVFGHSHEPVDILGLGHQRLFNPGSPTERRRQPSHTMGWLAMADGQVAEHRIVVL
ncbi:MAG TPA: metallophosphoesterase family protein [Acidimicrobiales bacterium]|nr:metallophosphoesterase family protein [Acidimicrobiales bacterium]